MNSLTLYLEEFSKDNVLLKHGLRFDNSLFVKMLIDGEGVEKLDDFGDSVIIFSELKASLEFEGIYLIFTCMCGIAEDGGWEGVDVSYDGCEVRWSFEHSDINYNFVFNREEYESEITSLFLDVANAKLDLEPTSVIFPEGFNRSLK